jgi:hypothetical protein
MVSKNFSTEELDELTISLREEENRYIVSGSKIEDVYNFLLSVQLKNDDEYTLCSLALKVLANYVADVPENAKFVFNLSKETLPIIPTYESVLNNQVTSSSVSFFFQVQLILFNNILTTSKESVLKSHCEILIDKILKLLTICESAAIETDSYLIIEILDECQSIIEQIDIEKFMILRNACLIIRDKGLAEGEEDLVIASMNVCHKYSSNLYFPKLSDMRKEEIFFQLYNQLENSIDEQILLNVSFQLGICTSSFFHNLVNLLFDVKTKLLKIEKHIPMSLLLLSNEVVSEKVMNELLELILIDELTKYYFDSIYPNLSLRLPWELQSIVLFNKIPSEKIKINSISLNNYINKLNLLINNTTLQINTDVISLQLTFLGKILGSENCGDFNFRSQIDKFLDDLKLSNEYEDFPNGFKLLLNQVYFPFLYNYKDKQSSNNQFVNKFLEKTLIETKKLLSQSMNNKSTMQMNYLIELSKIFGFYVQSFGEFDWFNQCFEVFRLVFNDVNNQMKQMGEKEQNAWKILENNIKYTSVILSQDK